MAAALLHHLTVLPLHKLFAALGLKGLRIHAQFAQATTLTSYIFQDPCAQASIVSRPHSCFATCHKLPGSLNQGLCTYRGCCPVWPLCCHTWQRTLGRTCPGPFQPSQSSKLVGFSPLQSGPLWLRYVTKTKDKKQKSTPPHKMARRFKHTLRSTCWVGIASLSLLL